MSYEILTIDFFDKQLKRLVRKYPSLKSEFTKLVIALKTDPKKGTSIGQECYKIRLAIASKGKGILVVRGLLRMLLSLKLLSSYYPSMISRSRKT